MREMYYEVNFRVPVKRNTGRAEINDWQDVEYLEFTGDDVLRRLAANGTEFLVSVRLISTGGWLH